MLPADYSVRILGRSGWTTREIHDALADALRRQIPHAIILECGINDIQATGYDSAIRSGALEAAKANFKRLAGLASSVDCPLIVLNVFPRGPRDLRDLFFWTEQMDRDVTEMNRFLESMDGRSIQYLDVGTSLNDENGFIHSDYATDTLHLNQQGYQTLSAAVFELCGNLGLLPDDGK